MANFFMGLDCGTGGGKVCIIDENADVMAYSFREFPIVVEKQGWSEHYPEIYWQYACEMIKECIKKANVDAADIKCISLSSAVPSMVMIDGAGNPINRAYNLMDRRAKEQTTQIYDIVSREKILNTTGNMLEDHPMLVNLLWEKANRLDDYRRIDSILTTDGYIRFKMTGEKTFNYGAGLSYGVAYNIRKKNFDTDILSKLDIDPEILPRATDSADIVGYVTQSGAECGLAVGTAVTGGQVDCNASWLGAGAIEEGDIQMNLGTVGNFGLIHKNDDFVDGMIVAAYSVDAENTYITIPTTTTGGQALRYIRDNFCQAERGLEKSLPIDTYDMLNMQAQQVDAGSDGLIVMPYLMGERSPLWDVDARGMVFGLSLMHGKGHVVRATMEGVAYALYRSFKIMKDSGKKINSPIVMNEGGAKSVLWRSIITDVFNIPTMLCENRTGAPYGDALQAAVVYGAFSDFSIAKEKAKYVEPLEPNTENNKRYMEYFALFCDLYDHVKQDYKVLASLRDKK